MFHNAEIIGNVFAGLLFAVSVYLFTKYSIKKLKWPGIISYIIVSSIIGLASFYAWARAKHFGCHYPRRRRRIARV